MPFEKGRSGNPKGRPRQPDEQNLQKKQFKKLLLSSTVSTLETIIKISNDPKSKDRLNACKYLIDKAYGSNPIFLSDNDSEDSSVIIKVIPYSCEENDNDVDWDEASWEEDEKE